ncbi:MAG: cell division protein FtsZ, partial [Acidimicrobiales bacterium]
FEVNEAAEIIHGVAHPDANIIFGQVIDDSMGDEVRVTVIAAGFEQWDDDGPQAGTKGRNGGDRAGGIGLSDTERRFGREQDDGDLEFGDDDFDVPDFLK